VRAATTDLLTGHPQCAVVVLGGLNDEVEAATTQILNGPPGSEIGTSASTAPTTVTRNGFGTSPRGFLPSGDSAESTGAAKN
jgi:hypothetical protein